MKRDETKVAVVILNYNTKHYLEQFLPGILEHLPTYAKVYIVDNASDDAIATKRFIAINFPTVEWIQHKKNIGYTGGYNVALKQINARYYVLLNSDVEVSTNWIENIIEAMDADDMVAAAMPKIKSFNIKTDFEHAGAAGGFLDFLGYPFCRGRIFDAIETDNGQYDNAIPCFWASGAAFFVRSKLFHNLNGFDHRFFMHMEEIDFCWRIQKMGFKIMCYPKSEVYHVGGGQLNYQSPTKNFFNFRNSLLASLKNWTLTETLWKLPLRKLFDFVAFCRFLLQGKGRMALTIIKAYFSLIPLLSTDVFKTKKDSKYISTLYRKSIVWQYFIKRKNSFSNLKFMLK